MFTTLIWIWLFICSVLYTLYSQVWEVEHRKIQYVTGWRISQRRGVVSLSHNAMKTLTYIIWSVDLLSINLAFYTSRRKHIEDIWQETSEVTSVRRPHWCSFHLSHVHVSNKGMYVSVPEVRRHRRTGSSAVNVHGCSRQKVQISAGVCWGRESLPHHRQHCQPCVKRDRAGRQPNNPTRGHIFCYGSRSAAFCKPEFGSKATKFLDVVVCIVSQSCRY